VLELQIRNQREDVKVASVSKGFVLLSGKTNGLDEGRIAIGSDRMMNAVREARATVLRDLIRPEAVAIGSINSPMRCMLNDVWSQYLQRHVEPATGKDGLVFSCFNHDQALDQVDFAFLAGRLRQNSAAEKLTSLWLDHLFEQRQVQAV